MTKICDICGSEIKNAHINTKRHPGECHREYMRRYAQAYYISGSKKKYKRNRPERKKRELVIVSLVTCPKCRKKHTVEGRVDRAARVYCLVCDHRRELEYSYAEGL